MAGQPPLKETFVDPDLDHKTKKVSDKFSEIVNVVANEPSLAFYRIQEHVRKTLPQLVDQKHEVEDIQAKVQGSVFDAEYATNAVKAMQNSAIHFQNIQDLLKNAMFMKQQISYEEARRAQGNVSPSNSANGLDSEHNLPTAGPSPPDHRIKTQGQNDGEEDVVPVPWVKGAEDASFNTEVETFMSET